MLRNLVLLILTISLALPSVKDWGHLLSGNHSEIHCDTDIPNHIHKAEFDCDFHKFHFSVASETIFFSFALPTFHTFKSDTPEYNKFLSSTTIRYYSLRGPPTPTFL